jgi:hypothetical protein
MEKVMQEMKNNEEELMKKMKEEESEAPSVLVLGGDTNILELK